MRTKLLFTLAISLISFTTANAQKKSKQRVQHGIKTGEVTKKEAAAIREEKQEVKEEVKEAKADGVITKEERKEIKEERQEANQAIKRSKHNAQKRK